MAKRLVRTKAGQQQQDFTLEIPQFVTMPLVQYLIDRAQPLLEGTRRFRKLTVNAGELSHISPVGLAALASILLLAARNRLFEQGLLTFPKKAHVRTYLARMNFNRLLRVRGPGLERPHRSPRKGRFRELVEIETEDDCTNVTNQLCAVLRKQVSDTLAENVSYCLPEVLDNVLQHAHSPTNAVACAQAYAESGAVELAIVDCGIGIRGSLQKNPEYVERLGSDADAIRLALQKGVTSNPVRNTGEGLFFVAELLAKSGRMKLHSGEAMLTINRGTVTPRASPKWPGTLVGMRFERKRGIPIREIFDKYSPLEEEEELFPLEDSPKQRI